MLTDDTEMTDDRPLCWSCGEPMNWYVKVTMDDAGEPVLVFGCRCVNPHCDSQDVEEEP
jgi:hypothetical protein